MTELETLKALLTDAEDAYSHAIAVGDWDACATAKGKVAKIRNRIGKIIKERMQLSAV